MDLWDHVGYRAVVGSQAFGLSTDASDIDKRGWYLPPASQHWSLDGVPEQLENEETQETYWELEKFLKMALQANPNVLETLYSPLVEVSSPLSDELLSMRECFLSKLAYDRYVGYADSQLYKLRVRYREKGEVNWKHAMHLVRLLIAGTFLMREGAVLVDVSPWREELLRVKRGEMRWEAVEAWRADLQADLTEAFRLTSLPDGPDRDRVNDFLLKARRSMVDF